MAGPTVAVGMAVYDDFQGLMYSLQSLALYHRDHLSRIVVVDNNPSSPDGAATRRYAESFGDWVRYVPYGQAVGTAPAKDAVFRFSDADVTVCQDAHVLNLPGTFEALRAFYEARPDSRDLLYGTLVGNFGENVIATGMKDEWSGGMWGVWETDDRGRNPRNPAFEVWSGGGGWFATRTADWLGFHPAMRGFGGEEGYLAEKYARAGRRVWSLPGARWWHAFDDALPEGKKRKGDRLLISQARNYAVGLREIGVPLDRAAAEFADRLGREVWDQVLAESDPSVALPLPVVEPTAPAASGCGCKVAPQAQNLPEWASGVTAGVAPTQPPFPYADAGAWYDVVTGLGVPATKSVLPVLKALAAEAPRVAEASAFTHPLRVALAAGLSRDGVYESWAGLRRPGEWAPIQRLLGDRFRPMAQDDPAVLRVSPCDLFVWDRQRLADTLYRDLVTVREAVSRKIVVVGAGKFGSKGDGGGPGLHAALVRFMQEHPEWSVVDEGAGDGQEGFVVLSRDPKDKPKLPDIGTMAWGYSKALFKNWRNGGLKLPLEMAEERLSHCWTCKLRVDNRCTACGCYLDHKGDRPGKVFFPEQGCPINKWGPVDPKDIPNDAAAE